VHGLWFLVYGLWFLVYGLWFLVYGLGFRPDHRPSPPRSPGASVLGFGVKGLGFGV